MGLRVLVVDDSRLMRVLLREAVKASGIPLCDLADASDGEHALQTLRQRPFDVLITDLHMPRVDGFELIARIGSLPELASLRLVTVSSDTGPHVARRLSHLPIHAHFTKPVGFETIRRVLRDIWCASAADR
jgi:two-component system chemotaxis response regulator CheY